MTASLHVTRRTANNALAVLLLVIVVESKENSDRVNEIDVRFVAFNRSIRFEIPVSLTHVDGSSNAQRRESAKRSLPWKPTRGTCSIQRNPHESNSIEFEARGYSRHSRNTEAQLVVNVA
jgi:hypothetical protein